MGFVQADPIRAPARAQDLILRHRVKDYRAGDLERRYPDLDIEEDMFYAYGFLPRANWRLLHPRTMGGVPDFDRRVLQVVESLGRIHPRELEAELGRERALNPWGGYSKATTGALHRLHFRGLLRIAGRENGIRMYEAAGAYDDPLAPDERARRLVLLICRILAPVPLRSLREALALCRHTLTSLDIRRTAVDELTKSGELEGDEADGLQYVWPAGKLLGGEAPAEVRLLAPFDPVVWDRRRFEHFWGWPYRFEAYTPEQKRVRGYYAMPMLWRDRVEGWANARVTKGKLDVEIGFVEKPIKDRVFRSALDEEIERMRVFLG